METLFFSMANLDLKAPDSVTHLLLAAMVPGAQSQEGHLGAREQLDVPGQMLYIFLEKCEVIYFHSTLLNIDQLGPSGGH